MTYEIDLSKNTVSNHEGVRKSSQSLMPDHMRISSKIPGRYDIYPSFSLGPDKIFNGFDSLANYIIKKRSVIIDGYGGVFWNVIKNELQRFFTKEGYEINWIDASAFLKPPLEIERLVQPFLGTEDSVWGTRASLQLSDFFAESITQETPVDNAINIFFGTGAALADWDAPVIFIDVPKNEVQFRMRAGSITNLGCVAEQNFSATYKRFYFVDWVVLNNHKKAILPRISIVADGQWPHTLNWCFYKDLKNGLEKLSKSVLRVRPWFEPGAWGGQWMKNNIDNLDTDVINLAWSFELIVPENGVVFESNDYLLEVSFDTLMFSYSENVLGKHAATFGDEFPIRFDFLDTMQGGNLSIQCHPTPNYIAENFGEKFTQDETYYILECEENAKVYLGFQEDINPAVYRSALETSQQKGEKIDIEQYVQSHKASKHDLFLIPNSTVHSAGAGNLVLEISATPYIFTFKMYDWLRLDLDGNPRPINIAHAFNNLDFERKGEKVARDLISKPRVIEISGDYQLVHLPTHAEHFYDVHRLEFDTEAQVKTADTCHVLMVVEGESVLIETASGVSQQFSFAETFVIPAAAVSYTLTNLGQTRLKVIKAFIK